MAETILVAGTASHVGKSTVVAGLCRSLADRGLEVAPFKAQNMSNNARVVPRAGPVRDEAIDGEAAVWGEIGVSQFVQARAARMEPTTDVNPVLLKPRGDRESQLVIDGRVVGHVEAGSYYDDHWDRARAAAEAAHGRLAADHDVVVAEGAGSIAEINLHDRDLANLACARFADADVLVVVDIERGGAFASLYGTLELVPPDVRERIVGAIITKFRGDRSLLEPGIRSIEERTGVPVLGVLPYADPGLPEEDSVALPARDERAIRIRGGGDGVPAEQSVTIAVPRLPRLSNATDLEALAAEPGVRVAYVPVDPESASDRSPLAAQSLEDADAVVIPGSKNTVDDLRALRDCGFDAALEAFDGPVVGICGGYQMLGERLTNVGLEAAGDAHGEPADEGMDPKPNHEEGTDTRGTVTGLGVLPVETQFEPEKRLERVTVTVDGDASPLFAGFEGTAAGYEIHAGRTRVLEPESVTRPFGPRSGARGAVVGTYLHGLFDNDGVREAFLAAVRADARVPDPTTGDRDDEDGDASEPTVDGRPTEHSPYDRAAALVEDNLTLTALESVAATLGEPCDR